jgi:hypothetical protein
MKGGVFREKNCKLVVSEFHANVRHTYYDIRSGGLVARFMIRSGHLEPEFDKIGP